jgi:hypothetical protein
MPLQRWVEPQLPSLMEKAPTGPNWDHCANCGRRRKATDAPTPPTVPEGTRKTDP